MIQVRGDTGQGRCRSGVIQVRGDAGIKFVFAQFSLLVHYSTVKDNMQKIQLILFNVHYITDLIGYLSNLLRICCEQCTVLSGVESHHLSTLKLIISAKRLVFAQGLRLAKGIGSICEKLYHRRRI